MFREGDTIVAVATPPGRGALALVRVSGPATADILSRIFCATQAPAPRLARVGEVVNPASGEVIDRAVAVFYRAPYSYTGEDMAEITVHAGPAVVAATLEAIWAAGARPAEPGEFTWRAVRHGKMDVTAAAAVADLARAQTAAGRADAVARLAGELNKKLAALREAVVAARAQVEAALEFGVEVAPAEVASRVDAAAVMNRDLLAAARNREALMEGPVVAIAGPPNVGKSTLFNRLVGEDRAIVTPSPGTTRDRLEAAVVFEDVLCRLADGAGLTPAPRDEAEAEGVRRAQAFVAAADVVIWMEDVTAPPLPPTAQPARKGATITVANKCDLTPHPAWETALARRAYLPISAKTGAGLGELTTAVARTCKEMWGGTGGLSLSHRERRLLAECADHLVKARRMLLTQGVDELAAEELRLAAESLGRVTGEVDAEELYAELFRRFCIGK